MAMLLMCAKLTEPKNIKKEKKISDMVGGLFDIYETWKFKHVNYQDNSLVDHAIVYRSHRGSLLPQKLRYVFQKHGIIFAETWVHFAETWVHFAGPMFLQKRTHVSAKMNLAFW